MIVKKIKKILTILIGAIYPPKCICCGEIIEDGTICNRCDLVLERISPDNLCLSCGIQKEYCECKYKIFRFNAAVCSFQNEGLARKAYYSYKFRRKQHYAKFFAGELYNSIKHCYQDITFDMVCAVPSYNKYDYDHCGYIARIVAGMLNIPYERNLISCIKKTKKQHKSTINERLHNVDGKYRVSSNIKGKTVLLIDDIKTTGATLDECSRMLLFAGADSVYCATVLGGSGKEKIEK